MVIFVLWRRRMRKQRVEETVRFVSTKERSRDMTRMRQMRDRWLENLREGEYYPEDLSMPPMARRDDFDFHGPIHLDHHRDSRSVYSQDQDVGMTSLAWQGPGTVSIRNSVDERVSRDYSKGQMPDYRDSGI